MPTQRPELYDEHVAAGADFTEFGGWEMPVSFEGIRAEHTAVREAAGVFDVSHMGEIAVEGPDATELMDRLTTNDVTDLASGEAQYACILDEEGVILDDTVVYRYPEREGYLFVPNAGHDAAMAERWSAHAREHDLRATVRNESAATGLLAVQGPEAPARVDAVAAGSLADVPRFAAVRTTIAGVDCLAARTGYTGEDGFEIFFDASESRPMWNAFADTRPCGLGARDTLRLEAGFLLSGTDFDPESEPRTPLEAGLSFAVDFEKPAFVGKEALEAQREAGVAERLVGLELTERGVARAGYPILDGDAEVGHVTSGTMSPTLGTAIALGYVDAERAEEGTELAVGIRDRSVAARVVGRRFLETVGGN